MLQREPLYRRLGVRDAPSARNYGSLLEELTGQATITQAEIDIHEHCLAWLADALADGDPEAMTAIVGLRDKPCLLSERGTVIWPDEAAWLDSETVSQPFAGALDDRLVAPPRVPRSAAARLFKALNVDRLSDIARLRLAEEPESVAEPVATSLLRDRADLLLWLSPNQDFGARLTKILHTVEVRTTEALQVQAEIAQFDPPVRSAPADASAFYDADPSILYVKGEQGDAVHWTDAFSAIFASLEQLSYGIEIPPLVMTAAFVASMPTAADAERALRSANYRLPEIPRFDKVATDSITDAPEETQPEADVEEGESEEAMAEIIVPEMLEDLSQPDEAKHRIEDEPGRADPGSDAGTTQHGDATSGTPFKSRSGNDGFEHAGHPAAGSGGTAGQWPANSNPTTHSNSWNGSGHQRASQSRSSWHERRSRLISYVNAGPSDESQQQASADAAGDISSQIDMAAITAVVDYETRSGRSAAVQPHNNPGFDIVSTGESPRNRRLIEVKGLEGNWTERGVKLSAVQFATAQQYHNEYWIYVVEHARDPHNRRVNAIANPFGKVSEYWFDHGWKEVTEETATAMESSLKVGARIRHPRWGVGTISEVNRRGIAISLLVDFLDNGRKLVPFNADIEFMD
ncbi:DUF3883 domain-containing protein [Rhizobium laguerreae]|nr:DUF3883 domain-containing protein [Rhizobium laguerreae]